MSERPRGFSAWGNRQLPVMPEKDADPQPPEQQSETPYPARVAVKDVVSVVMVSVGDLLTVAGVGFAWGGAAAMIAGGVSLLTVGLLIGVLS